MLSLGFTCSSPHEVTTANKLLHMISGLEILLITVFIDTSKLKTTIQGGLLCKKMLPEICLCLELVSHVRKMSRKIA